MEALIITVLIILTLTLWVWAVIDIVKSRFINPAKKTFWLLIVLIFPTIGSIVYFQLKGIHTLKEAKKFQPDFNRTN